MRVIAGTARRLQLKTIDGLDTRPTTDRIKETLFNMLAPDLYNSRFLDLFAGSGGIGIEALSRGAKEAVFVEKNPRAMACINALEAVHRLHAGLDGFDFIFMDPPYHQEWERQVLEALADGKLLSENGIVIIEAAKDTGISFAEELGFRVRNVRIIPFEGLLADFAKAMDARMIIRGLRAITDFEYELQMAQTNHKLSPQLETAFLTTGLAYSYLSSSIVKEVAAFGGDISQFVPEIIIEKIQEKINKRRV